MAIGLEQEIADKLAEEISNQIDWNILAEILLSNGWTRVTRSPMFNEDVKGWLDSVRIGHVRSMGNEWLFEKEQDAIMFSLRWL
jgi:hypothetical protein